MLQTCAFLGGRMRGPFGAFAAFAGFTTPSCLLMFGLSLLYVRFGDASFAKAAFSGLKAVVTAVMLAGALDFAKRFCRTRTDRLLALTVGLWFGLGADPLVAMLGAAAVGALWFAPDSTVQLRDSGPISGRAQGLQIGLMVMGFAAGLFALHRFDPRQFDLAWTFVRIDLVAFGGAYVSLPLMLHEFVEVRGFMDQNVFLDGLALAQATPGPVVMTSVFAGLIAAGLPGAVVSAVSVFAPSFLLVTALTPVAAALVANRRFAGLAQGGVLGFVGLLAAVGTRFAVEVAWTPITAVAALIAFIALIRGGGVGPLILGGAGLGLLDLWF